MHGRRLLQWGLQSQASCWAHDWVGCVRGIASRGSYQESPVGAEQWPCGLVAYWNQTDIGLNIVFGRWNLTKVLTLGSSGVFFIAAINRTPGTNSGTMSGCGSGIGGDGD